MDNVRVFNPTFDDAMKALLADCETYEAPQVVIQGIITVLANPIKLHCWVCEPEPASGIDAALYPPPGFYASDLLVKLMQAVRALQWEVVSVILIQAICPPTLVPIGEDR